MKVWNGYGTEHSMALVMIGSFKTELDAIKTEETFNELKDKLTDYLDPDSIENRYSDEIRELLYGLKLYNLSPSDLRQFIFDFRFEREGNLITLNTDETDISAFLKIMIENRAKIEMFSNHDYPDKTTA